MAAAPDNFRRLREADIVRAEREECPEEYLEVIDGLDETEVNVLLDVWERLHAAGDRQTGAEIPPEEAPRFTTWIWF